jgi:hypothetical protein
MGPGSRLRVLALLLAIGAVGCATPLSQKSLSDTSAQNSKTRKSQAKSASLNPFQKSAPPAKSLAAKPKSSRSTVAQTTSPKTPKAADEITRNPTPAATSTTGKPSAKAGQFDATTLALIESELRDATPEEREQFNQDLKAVSADMVPKILSSRRLAIKYRERQETAATGAHSAEPERQVEQVGFGHSGIAADQTGSRQNATNTAATGLPAAGLGTKSPWNTGRTEGGGIRTADYSLQPGLNASQTGAANTANGMDPASRFQFAQAAAAEKKAATPGSSNPVKLAPYITSAPPAPGTSNPPPSGMAAPNPGLANPGLSLTNPGLANAAPQQTPPGTPLWGQLIPGKFSPRPAGEERSVPGSNEAQRSNLIVASAVAERLPGAVSNAGLESAAPNPAPSGQAAGWQQSLEQLTAAAAAEAAQLTPGKSDAEKQLYIEKQVYLRMLYLMSGQQERALQYIPGLDPADQEFWQQVFWGVTNYFDANAMPNSADRATQTIAQFNSAVLRLKEKAHLELRNVTFCHKISSYGDYERYPRDEFSPGQEVLLYAELGNFHSELTADGRYRTLLRSTLEIHKPGPQGEVIEQTNYPAPEDICRNHRRDYFLSYRLVVPQKISLGPHVMKLTVEDQLSQKLVSYTLNFTVK